MKNILFVLLILSATSCASYKRCQQKFANTIVDSVKVLTPVSVLVPRDSVITSFKTDTTYLYKEIQQGRAKVIIERTHTITTVKALCDTVTITKKVLVKVPGERIVWGVKPFYKTAFKWLLSLLIIAIAIILLLITDKKNDDLQTPNY